MKVQLAEFPPQVVNRQFPLGFTNQFLKNGDLRILSQSRVRSVHLEMQTEKALGDHFFQKVNKCRIA